MIIYVYVYIHSKMTIFYNLYIKFNLILNYIIQDWTDENKFYVRKTYYFLKRIFA